MLIISRRVIPPFAITLVSWQGWQLDKFPVKVASFFHFIYCFWGFLKQNVVQHYKHKLGDQICISLALTKCFAFAGDFVIWPVHTPVRPAPFMRVRLGLPSRAGGYYTATFQHFNLNEKIQEVTPGDSRLWTSSIGSDVLWTWTWACRHQIEMSVVFELEPDRTWEMLSCSNYELVSL